MSFSSQVREELLKVEPEARHCQLAELAAIFACCGQLPAVDGKRRLSFQSENLLLLKKCFTLLGKSFNIICGEMDKEGKFPDIEDQNEVFGILQGLKLIDTSGVFSRTDIVSPLLLRSSCCRRACMRGFFLAMGSMSDPEKSYHLEFVCKSPEQAAQLIELAAGFSLELHGITRKNHSVVYIKEGSGVVDLLNIMGAHLSLMEMENLRILKEMRNSINRQVNCETANINKTVTASSRQIEDIVLIQKVYGFSYLNDNLREMAQVRLEHPDAPLQELGRFLNPPVGKSGVNHRLRRLSEIAGEIRDSRSS